jgi:hypothetical protein
MSHRMPRRPLCLLVLLLCPWTALHAQAVRPKMLHGPAVPKGKVVLEVWQDRYTEKGRLGWLQTLSYEIEEGGQTLIRTVQRDHLRYLRSGDPYQEDTEEYSVETKDGKLIEIGYRTSLSKDLDLVVRGRPHGDKIDLEVLDHAGEKVVYRQTKPWDDNARGLYYQERLLHGKDLSPSKRYEAKSFHMQLNAVAPTTYTIIGPRKVKAGDEDRELVLVEQSYPKALHLDKSLHYLDPATGRAVLSTEDNSLFGLVSHLRVGKAKALLTFDGKVKDSDSPVTIDKPLPIGLLGLPRRLRVRIEMTEDDDPSTVFVTNARQQMVQKEGKTAEYRLAIRKLDDLQSPPEQKPGQEYLDSNFYVRSDDADVQKLAKEAVGEITDPRQKMDRITKFVRKKVTGGYGVGFAPADEVARACEGDCTEMGILAAALGRAVGVPTRIAFGLVYDPDNPGFGGHLWTEAWIDGAWHTFDATGVVPLLGAAYLKIEAYSFKDVLSPDELTAVRRAFAGRMKVIVLDTR